MLWILGCGLATLLAGGIPGAAAEPSSTGVRYQAPPPPLPEIVEAVPTPAVSLSPRRDWLAILDRPGLPSLAEIARPELQLGGLRIDPRTNGPSRDPSEAVGISLLRLADTARVAVENLPPRVRIGDLSWSPDGTRIAYTVTDAERVELWVTEVATGKTKRVIRQGLNAAVGTPFRWTSDSSTILCAIVPEDRSLTPQVPRVPEGPVIVESLGREAPARTRTGLLEDRYDELLFHYYVSAQLMRVDLGGDRKRLGGPATFLRFDPSPDGRYLLVEILHRPYSYQVPYTRFPRRVEIWSMQDGSLVKQVGDLPLRDDVPTTPGSVPTGPRRFAWRAEAGAALAWVEAQDGGDARGEAEVRDRMYLLPAPFTGDPIVLATLSERFESVAWGNDQLAVVEGRDWTEGLVRRWRVQPGDPAAAPELLMEFPAGDRYTDPGRFVTAPSARGREVLLVGPGSTLYLNGTGASPEGDRPFLDRFTVASRDTTRLWRSEPPHYETVVAVLDERAHALFTIRESREEPPNYFIENTESGLLRRITNFPDPAPALAGVGTEILRYQREDGVPLTATLYLPAGHDSVAGAYPLLVWVRPRIYREAAEAGQVRGSPFVFESPTWSSPALWATRGYAVLDDPSLPILAEGEADPNDTFAEQLVADTRAAVEAAAAGGRIDRERAAVGGHGYGALLAANLLVHSDLFRAGILSGGVYNLTDTPFGFPTEPRTLWEAPEVYLAMSPYLHAPEVEEPVLLLHGEEDRNPGTYPAQSERFYEALKGLGATVRLVLFPEEGHEILARQSVLHLLWEADRWLETYVRSPGAADPE
jgi:dipeptidyl aminopeptidase/acylaminoacyl peptidase